MNISNTYFGFTNALKPMLKAKVENILDNKIRTDNRIMSEKEWVYSKLIAGYRPSIEEDYQYWSRKTRELTKPRTLYKIENDGSFYELNKTFYDYALHIISKNFIDPVIAERFMTDEQQRLENENRIKAEQERKEQLERELKRQQEETEKQQKRVERLTKLQNTILSFTSEQRDRINKLTDYFITEYNKINKDNVIALDIPDIMRYYDLMNYLTKAMIYPETTISEIKYYRDLIEPNSKNPNRSNERYIRECALTNTIRNGFFGITDDMAIQTIRALLEGSISADEAHNRTERNKRQKAAQEDKMATYYRRLGTGQWIEEKGEKIQIEEFTVVRLFNNRT